MYCTQPGFLTGLGFIPCGKCEACKIAKKKEWSDRLIIESHYHPYNYFVTLTYAPEHYPEDESLDPDVLKKYLKRLGYYCGKVPQYFACGEYGDEDYTERAHYHLAIFSDKDIFNEILASWEFGNVDIKPLLPERCRYICGYVVKKMTKKDDSRLDGRHPEFFSNSRRPALGYNFFYTLVYRMSTDEQFRSYMLKHVYPPYSIMIGGRKVSLPRYVREKLRPFYEENSLLQKQKQEEKYQRDLAISQKIAKDMRQLYGCAWKHFLYNLRCERDSLIKKAYEKRQRKKI